MNKKLIVGSLMALAVLCGIQYITAQATSCITAQQGGTGLCSGGTPGQSIVVSSTNPLVLTYGTGSGGGGSTTTFNGIVTSTLTVSGSASVTVVSSTDANGGAVITLSASGGSGSSTLITGVSPIVVSQSGINATTSCPTCIATNTGNWTGTWQGTNSSTYYFATNPSNFPSSSGGSSTYIAVYCGTTALCGNSGLTWNSSTAKYSQTGSFPVFSIKNTSLSQFAGSGMYFLNGLSDNQGGVAFYSGINDAGDTQGFFTIDETDGNGGGTGHLILFTGTSSVLFYPPAMFATTLNASGTITQSGVPVLTGNQTITLTGAVTGSGATTIATTFTTSTLYGLFSAGTGLSFNNSTGQFANTGVTSVVAGGCVTVSNATGTVTFGSTCLTGTKVDSLNSITGATVIAGGAGIGVASSSQTLTVTNTGVTSNVAGTGISVSGATGAVTISNTGATSFNTQTGATVYNISCTSGCSVVTSTTSGAITVTGGGTGNLFVTPTSSVLANNEVVYASNGSSTVRATSSIYSFTNGDNTFGSSTDNGLLSVVNASNTQVLNISTSTNNTTTVNIQGFTMFSGSSTVTTPSIGGAIVSGGCDSATTTVDSSITSSTAVFLTTPTGNPGTTLGGTWVYSYLLSAGLIQTNVCSNVSVTPNSIPYVVKIIK